MKLRGGDASVWLAIIKIPQQTELIRLSRLIRLQKQAMILWFDMLNVKKCHAQWLLWSRDDWYCVRPDISNIKDMSFFDNYIK